MKGNAGALNGTTKRSLFQLHLSILVILTFIAGIMVWKNVLPKEVKESETHFKSGYFSKIRAEAYGWPIYTMSIHTVLEESPGVRSTLMTRDEIVHSFLVSGLFNGGACLVLLFIAGNFLEQRIARNALGAKNCPDCP